MYGSLQSIGRLISAVLALALPTIFSGCTTGAGPERNDSAINITDTSQKTSFDFVASKPVNGLADYTFKEKTHKVQWLGCQAAGATGTVVVMHRDEAGFDDKKFCEGWTAQAFLRGKFDVVGINRPGYVGSTGPEDFAGPKSIVAIEAGVKAAASKLTPSRPIVGVYGYASGAIAAAFYSKKVPSAKWLILGNGMYDLEVVAKETKGQYVRKELSAIAKSEGAVALENRSVAYDVSGLPKRIALYHGVSNEVAPLSQAQTFRDSLASSEYVVTLDALDGVSHELNAGHHRQILEVLVRAVQMPTK